MKGFGLRLLPTMSLCLAIVHFFGFAQVTAATIRVGLIYVSGGSIPNEEELTALNIASIVEELLLNGDVQVTKYHDASVNEAGTPPETFYDDLDAVIYFPYNSEPESPSVLGDQFAVFLESGGCVIHTVDGLLDDTLSGRFNDYKCLMADLVTSANNELDTGSIDTSLPFFVGVETLSTAWGARDIGSNEVTINNDCTVPARWNESRDPTPVLAVAPATAELGSRVSLNFNPFEDDGSWNGAGGDIGQVLRNSLYYCAEASEPESEAPSQAPTKICQTENGSYGDTGDGLTGYLVQYNMALTTSNPPTDDLVEAVGVSATDGLLPEFLPDKCTEVLTNRRRRLDATGVSSGPTVLTSFTCPAAPGQFCFFVDYAVTIYVDGDESATEIEIRVLERLRELEASGYFLNVDPDIVGLQVIQATCQDNVTPVCVTGASSKSRRRHRRELRPKGSKGSSMMEEEEPNGIPICVATSRSDSGKGKNVVPAEEVPLVFETFCVDPQDLADGTLEMGSSNKGKGSKYLNLDDSVGFQCGCCDPLLEGAGLPLYCPGRICEADPTPCSAASKSSKGGRKPRKLRLDANGGSNGSLNGGRRGGKGSKHSGVAICVGGATMCVDDLDPMFVGTDVQCGCCAGDDAEYC